MLAHMPDPAVKPKPRFRLASRAALKRLAILFSLIFLFLIYCYFAMIHMPGASFRAALPPLTDAQSALADELRNSITILADASGGVGRSGNRSTFYPRRFGASAAWIKDQLTSFGYTTIGETFVERGSPVPNFEVSVPGAGTSNEIVVIGAHYDAFQ